MTVKLVYLARRARTVSREDWPRTWKSHAIFASQFPAMSGTFDWMRYCNRVDVAALADLPVSADHDGVCVMAAGDLDTLRGTGFTPEQRTRIDADELRVFDRYTPDFSFYCTETLVRDGPVGEAALFRFLPRKDGTTHAAFDAQLTGPHATACANAADALGVQRWAINLNVGPPPEAFPFEGIEELWFPDVDAAARAVTHARFAQLADTLGGTCDMDRSVLLLTRPTHRWPRS